MQKTRLFPSFTKVKFMLFSKSGFTDALENKAMKQGDITLIGVDDMFSFMTPLRKKESGAL